MLNEGTLFAAITVGIGLSSKGGGSNYIDCEPDGWETLLLKTASLKFHHYNFTT